MNDLYPIFLKTDILKIRIVGGGFVAEEKLHFLLKSSPGANISLVAKSFRPATMDLIQRNQLSYSVRPFEDSDIEGQHMVWVATDDSRLNIHISDICRSANILVNVADNPKLCDFYLGGIVTKGDLKIAISTNGKSPVLAKRIRQFLEGVLPETTGELINNLHSYRKSLKGNFEEKLNKLNELTKSVLN